MTDFRIHVAEMRRPRLLLRAARLGLTDYCRDRDLKRLIDGAQAGVQTVVPRLLDEEARLEMTRVAGSATYSLARHIEVLIALLAEVRLLPRSGPGPAAG